MKLTKREDSTAPLVLYVWSNCPTCVYSIWRRLREEYSYLVMAVISWRRLASPKVAVKQELSVTIPPFKKPPNTHSNNVPHYEQYTTIK